MSEEEPILSRFPAFYFDIMALILSFVFFILLWISGPALTTDDPYHLAVAKMFYQSGTINLVDTLQYQPFGRP